MFQIEQVSILFITVVLVTIFYVVGQRLRQLKPNDTPKGFILVVVTFVKTINDFINANMGEKHGKVMSAYIGSVFIYIIVSNYSGLFGLTAPTSNFSVTLTLALISWLLIQATKIKENGFGGYIKGFFEPIFPFVIPNVFGAIAPLISMSLRLFGNVISGTLIMSLVYSLTAWLSSFVPIIGRVNIVSWVITPWLHLYFDLFSGFLQALLFMSLTSIFIAIEFNEQEEHHG